MSISQIKRYERERAALKQKIAEERAKVAAKVGAAIMKAIGDDRAEAFAADVIAAVKKTSAEDVIKRVRTRAHPASAESTAITNN